MGGFGLQEGKFSDNYTQPRIDIGDAIEHADDCVSTFTYDGSGNIATIECVSEKWRALRNDHYLKLVLTYTYDGSGNIVTITRGLIVK